MSWTAQCSELSESEFWDDMIFAPIKRMGFSDGPGAVFHGEPYDDRTCPVSKERTTTHLAHFVVKDAAACALRDMLADGPKLVVDNEPKETEQ